VGEGRGVDVGLGVEVGSGVVIAHAHSRNEILRKIWSFLYMEYLDAASISRFKVCKPTSAARSENGGGC
jgi:hypothetical protein